ncbi:prolyl 4-hydroxylase subunit alpha-3 [Eleutherodactylus coqui]|uniref:prolyl 4-hydroxylase subunit alpha-3 n=1 Tax=Eleutherodactylus coqui TaxID=57060 RepID=UPI00346194E4
MCPGVWIVLFFYLGHIEVTSGDIYSSMLTIQQALDTEKVLTEHLAAYLEEETYRLNDLHRFYNKVSALHRIADTSVSDPIFAYTLLKRLQSEWMNVVDSLENNDNLRVLKDGYKKVEKNLPVLEDVEGAAKGLMRLQDVYSLNVKGLTQGVFQSGRSSQLGVLYKPDQVSSMSADDCFHIGKIAYDMQDFYHSIPWLEEAVSKFQDSYGRWFTEDQGSLQDALDYLAFSYYKTGNVSRALDLSRECLLYDPYNMRLALNVAKYEKILDETPAGEDVLAPNLLRPNVTHLRTRDLYEGLCRTLGSQTFRYEDPRLKCSYDANSPYLVLQPLKKEVVNTTPYIVLYHDFVTDYEAKKIKELAAPWLQRSVVASGMQQAQAEYRISKSAWLKDTADPVTRNLDTRIAAATGLHAKAPYAEYLQVVNYGIGGHYEPHFDHATSRKSPLYRTNAGNRIATFMIYLSSVDLGGATAFIYANFTTPVVKNAAIFWWNLHRNGEGNEDMLHAGCPVLLGSKWVANKWIHEYGQEFNRPCGLNPGE